MSSGVVDDVVGFVIAHGEDAEDLIWHEHENGEPPPGLTDAEIAALRGALPLVQDAFATILGSGRRHLVALGSSHRAADTMRRARAGNLREELSFRLPVVRGRIETGMVMEAWGEPEIPVWGWIWVRERDRDRAAELARGVDADVWLAPNGNVHVRLVEPATGDRYEDLGQRAAARLWNIVRAVADGLVADDNAVERTA
ncbi:MAG TPA: hypothetical protein PKA64_03075 [Myxococcota bacterium]|nr:hypothetical protein [Myxococcota bacterium]